jgi:cysteine desulfurase
MMHVNNETGVIQPSADLASRLDGTGPWLHVDAAQGFGRRIADLRHPRIDLISLSGHKIHAPKGVGALVARRREGGDRPPIAPLMHGGGQERGWRPGTLPVPLIAGLGKASELSLEEADARDARCREFRRRLIEGLAPIEPVLNGHPDRCVPHIVNFSIAGVDAEAAIEAWQDLVAVSHGAACSSQAYTCSHVMAAMELPQWQQDGALRLSWCHFTPLPDWGAMVDAITRVRRHERSHVR